MRRVPRVVVDDVCGHPVAGVIPVPAEAARLLAELQREALRAAEAESKDTAVILLFVHGGPSHLETYDLKPDAPDEIRGPFKPIRTGVPTTPTPPTPPPRNKLPRSR